MVRKQMILPIRVIIDTNVVFEGLTRQSGATGLIIDLWTAGLIQPCFSNALVYEYIEVLSRKLSEVRWKEVRPILRALLEQAEFVTIHYSWRPSSPDPGDEHLVDCAMNANLPVVTYNVKDFRPAMKELGLKVITPTEFVTWLSRHI